MKTFWAIMVAISVIAFYGLVHANDSTARVGAGGITLLKSADIRIIQENLKISKKAIHVHYRFLNESNKDILTTVAFPMPSYGWNPLIDASSGNNIPLTNFFVIVDGIKMQTIKSRKALIGKRDITHYLKDAGLTDEQIFETFGDMTLEEGSGLNKLQMAKLRKIGALKNGDPAWKVAETAYWEQLFPAKKEIEVEHIYQPFVGQRYSYDIYSIYDKDWKKHLREACLDKTTQQTLDLKIKSLLDKGASAVVVYLHDVEYVLGTGRNWKGPIDNFTLSIEKDSPDQLISVCFPGKPRIIDSTTIEFRQTRFVPQDRLVVNFYTLEAEKR